MKQMMYIDTRIAMYQEDAVRILAVYDTQNDTITISKTLSYNPPKDPYKGKSKADIKAIKEIERNRIIVTDNEMAFDDWDLVFNEVEHLDEAVRAFYLLSANKTLILEDKIESIYNPKNVIEVRKTGMSGNVYELNSEECSNGIMAVLATCWAAIRMKNAEALTEKQEIPTQEEQDDFITPFSI